MSQKKNSGQQACRARINRPTVSKAILISGIILLVAFVPFIASNPEEVSNAFAPGPHLGVQTSISESDMPTYIANASDPYAAFQFTGMGLSLQAVSGTGGGHEIYTYLQINPSQSSQISTSNILSETTFTLPESADNAYWYVTNGQGKNYGTVGADIAVGTGNVGTLDQYVNVNYDGALGSQNNPSAHCNTEGTGDYPPSVDTGGEERWGMILVVTNPSQSVAYEITGGLMISRTNGQADMIILVNPTQTTPFDFSNYCSVPNVAFSSNAIDWTVRAPPPTNTVPGNYEVYSTTGGEQEKSEGTTSMINLQYINPDSTTSSTTTSTTITSTTQSTSTSTGTTSSTTSSTESSSSSTITSTSSPTTTQSTSTSTTGTSTSTSHSTTSSSSTSSSATSSSTISSSTSSSTDSTSTTTTTVTSTSTTTCTTPECTNPYWNSNSQEVATYVADNLFNPQVGLIATSALQGCIDYVGGLPCQDTFWTTSDNVPLGWTLQDFGYQSDTQAIIKECTYLQCEGANTGDRYEAYIGWPIVVGSPGDIHAIFSPGSDTLAITCSTSGCGDSIPAYGTLSDGTPYKIQADVYSGSPGSPSTSGPVDVVGPQAINYYLMGNMPEAMKYGNALVSLWNGYSVDGSGGGDTWHLGQVMFVMRVLGMDTSTNETITAYGTETYSQVFQQMENELWAIQAAYNCKGGCLPNSYTQTSPGGTIVGTSGADAENQDAGLLPFSYTVVSTVRSDFGIYSTSGTTARYLHTNSGTEIKTAGVSTVVFLSGILAVAFGSVVTVFSPRLKNMVSDSSFRSRLTTFFYSVRISSTRKPG